MEEASLTLADGRTLRYALYGDPAGLPVVYCHGAWCCHRDVEMADAEASRLGLRLIAPDRPGVAGSSRRPGRTVRDWTPDLEALLAHLGVERFAVLGWSLGAAHALACAVRMPGRVLATTVVGPPMPMDEKRRGRDMGWMDRLILWLSMRLAFLACLDFWLARQIARVSPGLFAWLMRSETSQKDRELLRGGAMADRVVTAISSAAGMVDEYRALGRPWGFAPEDFHGHLTIWHGDEDRITPFKWGEELARRVPGAKLQRRAAEGHFLAFGHYAEILTELKEASRPGRR